MPFKDIRLKDSRMSDPTPDLGYGVTWPSLETFTELARTRRVIPVVRRLLADAETPVGVYRKLAKDAPRHLPAGVRRAWGNVVPLLHRGRCLQCGSE